MSILKLPKQLLPAKRAWKRITTMLKSKLEKLKLPKAIKSTTKKLKLPKAIKSTTKRLAAIKPLASIAFKRKAVAKPYSFSTSRLNHRVNHQHYNHMQKGYAAIYIDQLYAKSTSNMVHAKHAGYTTEAGTSRVEKQVDEDKKKSENNDDGNPDTIEDAWRVVVARSPQLRCVDERAEEFITNFKEDMRIQKERSLLEFQERLARSA